MHVGSILKNKTSCFFSGHKDEQRPALCCADTADDASRKNGLVTVAVLSSPAQIQLQNLIGGTYTGLIRTMYGLIVFFVGGFTGKKYSGADVFCQIIALCRC
jgi:hypothetical protein